MIAAYLPDVYNSPLYAAPVRPLARLDGDVHFCHQPMLTFGNPDPANDHMFTLSSKFRGLITIQEEHMINRFFQCVLAWASVLRSLRVLAHDRAREWSKHHYCDVQLLGQRFQTTVYIAELLKAILVPFSVNTRLNHEGKVDQHECDMMRFDQLSYPLLKLRR